MPTRYDEKLSRSSLRLSAFILALALAAGTAAVAQDWVGRGRAQGRVLHAETDKPLEGVQVTLVYNGIVGEGPKPVFTDKKGRWSFLGLRSGTWDVTLELEGFVTSEGRIRVTGQGGGTPANIPMRPIPKDVVDETAKKRRERVEEGNRHLAEERYAEARAAYEEVLAEVTDDAGRLQLRQVIAQTYFGEGDYGAARAAYQEILAGIEDSKTHLPLLHNIARTHYEESDVDQAVATLDKALEIVPDDPTTLKLTINLLVAAGQEIKAQAYMARLPEGETVDANAILNMGIKLYNENDLDGALAQFDRAVVENPELPDVYYYRGLVYLSQGKNGEAVTDFEKLLEIDPGHANAGEAQQFVEYLKSKE